MKALQILKRRMGVLFHGKGQVSLEWMMIAGAVIVLAVILMQSVRSIGERSRGGMSDAALKAQCELNQSLTIKCDASCSKFGISC